MYYLIALLLWSSNPVAHMAPFETLDKCLTAKTKLLSMSDEKHPIKADCVEK